MDFNFVLGDVVEHEEAVDSPARASFLSPPAESVSAPCALDDGSAPGLTGGLTPTPARPPAAGPFSGLAEEEEWLLPISQDSGRFSRDFSSRSCSEISCFAIS